MQPVTVMTYLRQEFTFFFKEDDGTDSVYIGEAENLKDRLTQHIRDSQMEKENTIGTLLCYLQVVILIRRL